MVSTRRHHYNQPKSIVTQKPQEKDRQEKVQLDRNQVKTNAKVTNAPISDKEDESINKLRELYENIKSTPSFSAKIEAFLRSNEVHSKFRRIVKRKFPRRKIITRFPFELFQADLIEYPKYKFQNNRYVYCLVVIDCFTKYVWVKPMKTKTGEETAKAFDSIFKDFDEHPVNLMTDSGLEFFNSKVGQVMSSYNIVHYKPRTKTQWKASMAERVIQTLKRRLEKYFYHNKTRKWIDIIEQVAKNYNNTPHSTHGFKPVDVTEENRKIIHEKMYPDRNISVICKFKIGDKVRKIREKTLFEKGYTQNWSDEVYKITDIRQSNGVCWYILKTLGDEEVSGIWYNYQLNLVSRNVGENQRKSVK